MNKKIFLYSLSILALLVSVCFALTFYTDINNAELNTSFITRNKLNAKNINSNSLIAQLNKNYNNFNNALNLNLDISNFVNYENDYYNYAITPTEHIRLNPYEKSRVIFNISDLKNIYFLDQANFVMQDAYNIILNDNLNVNIEASSYSVKLKNKYYNSSPISLNLKKDSFSLNLNLINKTPVDLGYCKIFRVDLKNISLSIKNNSIHNSYHYFNPNNNAYPSGILYMKSSFSNQIRISLNSPISFYFLYDLNFETLLTLNIANFINDVNAISNVLPTLEMNFNLEKLLEIWQLSDEHLINPVDNSLKFYYHFLWTKAIPLYFIKNKITASFEAYNEIKTIVLWENDKFIPFELNVKNNLNKQTNTIWNFKDMNNNILMKTNLVFTNNFNNNENIKLIDNKIVFYFTARTSFLKIEKFLLIENELLFNSNKYASELVDENKNIYDKLPILDFLNSQIKIEKGLLFNEILTFDEINFDKFINLENSLKPFRIHILNNNVYLPTYNENGEIFFITKIKNWKFINDLDNDSFQGDYSIKFKEQLNAHKNFIYLKQKEHFSDDGYFIVKILTNKTTTIYEKNDRNIFWKFNSENNLNSLKEHINNKLNYKISNILKSDFVFTHIKETWSLDKNSIVKFILNNPISIKYINANKNNFGNPIDNIFALIYNLPLNKDLISENKIILKTNDKYYLNSKYKFNTTPLANGELSLNISNKNDQHFNLDFSIEELINLFTNNLSKEEIDKIKPLISKEIIERKIVNWYFIFFIVILVLMIIGIVVYIIKNRTNLTFKK